MFRSFALFGVALLVCMTLTGVSSCEQKMDTIAGVHAVYDANGNLMHEADGTPKVIIDPDSPAAKALANASGNTGPIGILLSLAGGLTLTGIQELLKRRLKASLAQEEADHDKTAAAHEAEKAAHVETQNTLAATTSGLVSFAKANPTQANALLEHIDSSHDVHDVDPEHQDAIQSALSPPKIG